MSEEITIDMTRKMMKQQEYKCSCGNRLIMDNYMPDEKVLPALQCGRCRGGQGLQMDQQLYNHKGLLAVGEAALYSL